jgi:type IV secretory pathway TraG/TraD family ATPase VirD4
MRWKDVAEVAIVYDPHLQFVPRYYSESRGDILFNPLDARCPSWSPSDEIDFSDGAIAEANALAQATSLFPGKPSDRNWFFVNCSQLIWKHLICQHRPDAQEMAYLMQHSDPLIDVVVQGTELEQMMAQNAQQQRAGVVSHLTQIAYALRQIPKKEKGRPHVSFREWCSERRGWIFITNTQDTRAALRPIQSLMLDGLILRLLSMGERFDLPAVVMAIDELQTLQQLPQLMPLVTEGRKSLRVVLGFQGRSQIKSLYGEEAEAIFSAAYTKFMLRTSEPEASEWLSKTVGDVEIERLRENRPAHLMARAGHSYSTERRVERLVLPSEFQGLDDLKGYLKYGNDIVKFTLPIMSKIARAPGFVPRESQPIEKKPLPDLQTILGQQNKLAGEKKKATPLVKPIRSV